VVEVSWSATDDTQVSSRIGKWETRCNKLEDNRGKMLTLLESSITPELSSELLLRHSAQVDTLIAKRDTLGFLALIKTQSLELATKSKTTLRTRWEAIKQEKGEKVTLFLDRFERAGKLAAEAGKLISEEMSNLQLKKALYPLYYETVCPLVNLLNNTIESGNELVSYTDVTKEPCNYDAKNIDEDLAEHWAFFAKPRTLQPTKAEIDAIQAYRAFTA
jgi:hypothetical protein